MSSILTNNSAMVALQTLRSINSNMSKTQSEISTGKKIATAADNSAVWAISKVMESDVGGFKAISATLSLGKSTISVARSASEQVTGLLNEVKSKIVAAQEDNVDRNKLQDELVSLRNQIASITNAAQFNGLNLLSNTKTTTAYTAAGNVDDSGTTSILSSLDRSSTGVKTSSITARKQDLGQGAAGAAGALTLAAAAATAAGTATANGAAAATYTIAGETATAGRTKAVMAGDRYDFNMAVFDAGVPGTPFATATSRAVYVAKDGDTTADVARGLSDMINYRLAEQGFTSEYTITAENNVVRVVNNTATALAASAAGDFALTAGASVGGGMALLGQFNVSTENGALAALSAIEGLIQTSITAGAAFGTTEKRLSIQNEFVNNLIDSLTSGIGSQVDTDMEAASARLQALQVQQQLGIQALSIANQSAQNILALFR